MKVMVVWVEKGFYKNLCVLEMYANLKKKCLLFIMFIFFAKAFIILDLLHIFIID